MKLNTLILTCIVYGASCIVMPSTAHAFEPIPFNPNDPQYRNNWFVNTLELNKVWGYAQGEGVVVAVLDSGVDTDHPELRNQLWINVDEIAGDGIDNDLNGYIDDVHGYDFIDFDASPDPRASIECFPDICDEDAHHHGTLTSGLIASEGNNNFGIVGVAPKAKIMALRVLSSIGEGDASGVVKAVDYAVLNGAHIINMSFAGPFEDGNLTNAIDRALRAGVAIVMAAGNKEAEDTAINLNTDPRFPICNVITKHRSIGVTSVSSALVLSDFANYGECVDINAPGEDITGPIVYDPSLNFHEYIRGGFRGTSLSAPIVSGALAILKSYRPDKSMAELRDTMLITVKDNKSINGGRENDIGTGFLDILNALQALGPATVPEVPTEPSVDVAYAGQVVKSATQNTVYYIGHDGGRYYFPDEATYKSWYPDFSEIITLNGENLSQYQLRGIVTMRPGAVLIKIRTVPNVYAISRGGVLRHIKNEDTAISLYGSQWRFLVRDIDDAFFASYQLGEPIENSSQYDINAELLSSRTISEEKGL